ncbi:MAG: hypothetical protein V4663_05120 [Bacteroidota bacterium]
MAKVRSIMKLSGTIEGITFVDSTAYGAHSRAKRGTYTAVTLAEGMKISSSNQNEANLRAKIIFDAVNEFAPGFKEGTFWSRLISIFRKQKKAGKGYNYSDFGEMEMRYDYSTSKQGDFRLDSSGSSIVLSYNLKVDTGYRLSILRIATDETLLIPYPNEILEAVVQTGEKNGTAQFDFTSLPKETPILYALQCEQLLNGKLTGALKGKSVRFFGNIS